MGNYRIYRIGDDDHIKGVENVECGSDEEARTTAIELKANCPTVEVWSGKRFVARIECSGPERRVQRLT